MMTIGHLEPVAFLNSTHKTVKIGDPDDLLKRPEDISFMRFHCTLSGKSIDICIATMDMLSFQFYRHLPQYHLDILAKNFTPVASTPAHVSNVARSLGACFAASTPPPSPTTPASTCFGIRFN